MLFFISEPYAAVLGIDTDSPGHCGFTEYGVLPLLTRTLAHLAPGAQLYILPHPKHRPGEMAALWERCNNGLRGGVIEDASDNRVSMAQHADGVMGMASSLLYEAWLMGFPCLSFQPGCRLEGLRRYAGLPQICFSDDVSTLPTVMEQFLRNTRNGRCPVREEYQIHQSAASAILKKIRDCFPNSGEAK